MDRVDTSVSQLMLLLGHFFMREGLTLPSTQADVHSFDKILHLFDVCMRRCTCVCSPTRYHVSVILLCWTDMLKVWDSSMRDCGCVCVHVCVVAEQYYKATTKLKLKQLVWLIGWRNDDVAVIAVVIQCLLWFGQI